MTITDAIQARDPDAVRTAITHAEIGGQPIESILAEASAALIDLLEAPNA